MSSREIQIRGHMLTPDLGVQNPTELNLYSEESPRCTHIHPSCTSTGNTLVERSNC